MLAYKDMTFCPGDGCNKFNECPRALTPVVRDAARRWWGGANPPISMYAKPKKLDCYSNPNKVINELPSAA